jgi:hypothetical protein
VIRRCAIDMAMSVGIGALPVAKKNCQCGVFGRLRQSLVD